MSNREQAKNKTKLARFDDVQHHRIVRPAAAAPTRPIEQVEQHRAASLMRARGGSEYGAPASREGELSQSDILALLATRDGINLVRGFRAIKGKLLRETILALIAAIVKAQ